jgi:type IV secretory pathway TrbL component
MALLLVGCVQASAGEIAAFCNLLDFASNSVLVAPFIWKYGDFVTCNTSCILILISVHAHTAICRQQAIQGVAEGLNKYYIYRTIYMCQPP